MEPGVRKYLIRIVNTMSLGLLWMVMNSTIGIMYDFAFIHDSIKLGNILFYILCLSTLAAYLWWVIKIWSQPIDYDEGNE
jgi:hypothetical protein